ncbi:MAG TPA: GNAT family N-acetyltransferase [Gemmatimonadaceae bacterium]|nr:GNAT family N-acetyltransferase [Gemmatimonadaceae bacterium]
MNKYLRDIATFPADAHHAWRTDGKRGLWDEIAERSLYRIARVAHYDLYERELATIKHVPPAAGLEVRMLRADEYEKLGALMTRRRRAQLARRVVDRTVFAALRDGEVVGYSWWTTTFDGALDFSPLELPADAIFHGFVHVERAERHLGTASALFSAGEMYLHERGARVCWFLIKSSNIAGARTARGRWGGPSRYIARLSYWKLPFRSKRVLTLGESMRATPA